jgi:formylglycine-generating enzyme required for sulfatase activity
MKLRRTYRKKERYWNRVSRGGPWYYSALFQRDAVRYDYGPSYQYNHMGARLSRTRRKDET